MSQGSTTVSFRWGHSEGITAIDCVTVGGVEKLLTCGADGDLRIWKGTEDDDPVAHGLTDNGLALACGKENVYVGTEFNTVEVLSLEEGKNLGVKAKFTAAVNHLDLSKDEKWLIAGSGDMTIQIINLEDSSNPPVTLETHSAPVLSVALDPQKNFLATSGCDGSVCVWSLTEEGKPVHLLKKFENVFPSSNDISTSTTLCRISWEGNGKLLAIPEEGHIALYARDSWAKLKVLKYQKSGKIASVTKFSPCGTYLAAGGPDGTLTVWNVHNSSVVADHSQFNDPISGITFANNESDVVATDMKGRLLIMKSFKTFGSAQTDDVASTSAAAAVAPVAKDDDDNTDDDDLMSPPSSPKSNADNDKVADAFDDGMDDLFADDGDNEISISKIKADTGFIGDEYVGKEKAKVIAGGDMSGRKLSDDENDDDDAVSISSSVKVGPRHTYKPAPPPIKIPTTEPQKPFQPASSPVHVDPRFMVWNNIGIIRTYSHEDDEMKAIDVEFHDAAVHHAIHLRNHHDYTLATLSKEVAIFASDKQESDLGSKLFCYSFNAWDTKKEWSTDLPDGEEIIGLAAGEGWIAASTDMNRIRLFTTGGAQRQIIEVGGQIITSSGNEDLLFVAYHTGIGLHGNQCIAYSIFRIKTSLKPFPLVSCEPLPISPKSQLAWLGFSDEGTPVFSDSKDILRILSGRYWTTFCSMKEHLISASSDHFWVVGVSELDQRIRAVKCKGMKYPPTLPRPVLMQLDAQIPFCEMETEKSRLEDRLHRSLMLDALAKKMDKKNYDVDEYKTRAEKELKESLFNLFVLSCKGDWDARGTEYVAMMPSAHAVQVAVKYASKLRRKGLIDRLTAIGRKKLDDEDLEMEGDDDDFETLKMGTVVYTNVQNRTLAAEYSASQDLFADSNSSRFNMSSSSLSTSLSTANRSIVVPEEENPFMKKNTDEIRKLLGAADNSGNRFRKEKQQSISADTSDAGKGLSVIDSWKKPTEKPTDLFVKAVGKTTKGGRKSGADKKDAAPANKEKKKQATLLDMGKAKSKETPSSSNASNPTPASPLVADEGSNDSTQLENHRSEDDNRAESSRNSESLLEDSTNLQHQDEQPAKPKKKGYMLWFDENKEMLQNDNPGKEIKELTLIGMKIFKQLSDEEKQKYTGNQSEEKKRKRSEVEDLESEKSINGGSEGDKKSKLSSKLAAFVRPAKE